MKCPVCSEEIETNLTVCQNCGFDDIRYEFINDDELVMWQTYVVKPCQYAYRLNHSLQNEVSRLRREIMKMSSSRTTTAGSYSVFSPTAKTNMSDGWNFDDPIAHPNAAAGNSSYNITFSVSNIKSRMTSSSAATVTFLAKKESDKNGNSSTDPFWIRYRVRDNDGIILLNETHYVGGLQVGDVTRETIELTVSVK